MWEGDMFNVRGEGGEWFFIEKSTENFQKKKSLGRKRKGSWGRGPHGQLRISLNSGAERQ